MQSGVLCGGVGWGGVGWGGVVWQSIYFPRINIGTGPCAPWARARPPKRHLALHNYTTLSRATHAPSHLLGVHMHSCQYYRQWTLRSCDLVGGWGRWAAYKCVHCTHIYIYIFIFINESQDSHDPKGLDSRPRAQL